jgi:hypothetical protein
MSGPEPDYSAPFCARCRDMRSDDGGIKHLDEMRGRAHTRALVAAFNAPLVRDVRTPGTLLIGWSARLEVTVTI